MLFLMSRRLLFKEKVSCFVTRPSSGEFFLIQGILGPLGSFPSGCPVAVNVVNPFFQFFVLDA